MGNTLHRNYPKPEPETYVSDDVSTLRAAFDAIDLDVFDILAALSGKSAVGHVHAIGDVSGLQSALDGKAATSHNHTLASLSDVNATGIAAGYLLQWSGTQYIPVAPATALGSHTHLIADISGLAAALNDKIDASALAAASAKGTPVDADQLPLLDSAASNGLKKVTWANIKATLKGYFDGLYATVSHAHAISDITGLVSALASKAALSHTHAVADITGLAISKFFESTPQAITLAGLLTLPHGLGVEPKMVQIWAKCATAESGYAVGDMVLISGVADHIGNATGQGLSTSSDATNINIRVGANNFSAGIINKSTGTLGFNTAINWRLVVRAFA